MKKSRSPLYVTTLIASAFFMEMLDGTIIATALPQMAHSFHTSAVSLNIGMTAYLLTLAVFIPISGWVADRFGARSVFAAAIGTFTLASVLCGASHTLTQFTLMRILQGIGGAMMVPVGRLIVLRSTSKEKLTEAIAYITWPGLTALVVGPPGRLYHYLRQLALDLLPQSPYRHHRPGADVALGRERALGREPWIRLADVSARGFCLSRGGLWDGEAGE
jgi:MFS family permease